MAVRAYRPEIFNRIYLVLCSDRGERFEMMHMNESRGKVAIGCTEIQAAGRTNCAVRFDASGPCNWVAFVRVDSDFPRSTLYEWLAALQFALEYLAVSRIPTRNERLDNFIPELPYEAAIRGVCARGNDMPPFILIWFEPIGMSAKGFLDLATNPAHGAIHLNYCR